MRQVRCLASAGSMPAQGAQAPKAAHQSQNRPAPLVPAASAAPQVEGGSGAQRCHGKSNGQSSRSVRKQGMGGGGRGEGWVDLSGPTRPSMGSGQYDEKIGHSVGGSRLCLFLPAWQQITSDRFVLEVVQQGYSLPFVGSPFPLSRTPV